MLVLNTPRLVLRWFSADDAGTIVELLNDPGWKRFIGERHVHTEDEARAWIAERLVAPCWRQGFGLWAMERRSDGAVLGMCGLVKRDSLPEIDLGYALLPRHRGHGYVGEAAAACLDYGADVLGLGRILAITRAENEASIQVLRNLGMVQERRATLSGDEHEAMVFAWQSPAHPGVADARMALDALVQRFYAAFTNADGRLPRVAALPFYFVPEARIVQVDGTQPSTFDLPQFVTPRAALLQDGRLTAFDESEDEHHTHVEGRIAQRRSHYRKSGILDGQPFTGRGTKLMQFVDTPQGWRISALAWQDAT